MNDLRKDPVSGRWVIIAADRARRPRDFHRTLPQTVTEATCPLCPGNEAMTPPEIWRWSEPDGSWSIRVIPNKFPALRIEGDLIRLGEGLFDHMSGIGAHEIIVDSPHHKACPEEHNYEQMFRILTAYKVRLADLEKDTRLRYGLVFKNVGAEAGASLSHPHSQLIAMPIIPKHVKEELTNCMAYYDLKERCLFCDIINQELQNAKRVIAETEFHVAWMPYASRFPFETWILPKKHNAAYTKEDEAGMRDLAALFQQVIAGLCRVLEMPPYNYVLHTRPFRLSARHNDTTLDYDYHWHIEIIPRLTKIAGFEWGSGFYINPTPPEEAARVMRETLK